jgi:hypothetical protein
VKDLTSIDHNYPTKTMWCRTDFGEEGDVEVPVVDHLDARVLQQIERDLAVTCDQRKTFGMDHFRSREHSCGTAHCVAGWYIGIAGKQGQDLLDLMGESSIAAQALFEAANPGQSYPPFDASCPFRLALIVRTKYEDSEHPWDDYCLDQLRERAAADPLPDDAA